MRRRDYAGFNRSFDRDYRAGDAKRSEARARERPSAIIERDPPLYT